MGLIKIQCKECSRIVDYDEYYFSDDLKCRECGGYFDIIDEPEEEDYDESEEDEELEDEDESEEELSSEEKSYDSTIQNRIVLPTNLKQDNTRSEFDPEQTTRFD